MVRDSTALPAARDLYSAIQNGSADGNGSCNRSGNKVEKRKRARSSGIESKFLFGLSPPLRVSICAVGQWGIQLH
jgi:hypothetical protein